VEDLVEDLMEDQLEDQLEDRVAAPMGVQMDCQMDMDLMERLAMMITTGMEAKESQKAPALLSLVATGGTNPLTPYSVGVEWAMSVTSTHSPAVAGHTKRSLSSNTSANYHVTVESHQRWRNSLAVGQLSATDSAQLKKTTRRYALNNMWT
jgi:hypothetical protein